MGILMIGMLVAYNDESLLSLQGNNTASSSPFVIAIRRSGIKGMFIYESVQVYSETNI